MATSLLDNQRTDQPARDPLLESAGDVSSGSRWREVVAIAGIVLLADLTIYRGAGYAGLAAFFVATPFLLATGKFRATYGPGTWLLVGMIVLLAARMVWLGDVLAMLVGFTLVAAYSVALAGRRPFALDIAAIVMQLVFAGAVRFVGYFRVLRHWDVRLTGGLVLKLVLPLGAVAVFSSLFILANPDLVTRLRELASDLGTAIERLSEIFAERSPEFFFWVITAYLAIGLLRPLLNRQLSPADDFTNPPVPVQAQPNSAHYDAVRNTLWAVIGLFAVYLAFEFGTLWFRKFPPGFYYAGYAHQGAAWLTVALALATLCLSLMFRGHIVSDPRLPGLRRLAWVWSAENFILALAVFNRMYIYIDFNGMTRMRTIGLFGISTVVAGFVLVVWKIVHVRSFVWLVQRQLWALGIAIWLFVLTPVDFLVHSYNVQRILAGDLAPAVQISVHPINAEGLLVLEPLSGCQDPIIRNGVRAMFAQEEIKREQLATRRLTSGWTALQVSDHILLGRLRAMRVNWQEFADPRSRESALKTFHDYAYQWY